MFLLYKEKHNKSKHKTINQHNTNLNNKLYDSSMVLLWLTKVKFLSYKGFGGSKNR